MRDLTVDEIARLDALPAEADEPFHMTEEAFRVLYERTARSLWAYLARMTGDARLADDLLQETYYRFLKSSATLESDDHRKNYLFRIATNVAHDARRRSRADGADNSDVHAPGDVAVLAARSDDIGSELALLQPPARSHVWH